MSILRDSGHESNNYLREVKFMDHIPLAEFGDNHTHVHTHTHTHTHTLYRRVQCLAHTRCIIPFFKQNVILQVEVSRLPL